MEGTYSSHKPKLYREEVSSSLNGVAKARHSPVGDRIRGTLGNKDPFNKVPAYESQKDSLSRVPLVLPRKTRNPNP